MAAGRTSMSLPYFRWKLERFWKSHTGRLLPPTGMQLVWLELNWAGLKPSEDGGGGGWRNNGTQDSLDLLSLCVKRKRGSWVTAAFSTPLPLPNLEDDGLTPRPPVTQQLLLFFSLARGLWLCLTRFYLEAELLFSVNISSNIKRVTCEIKTCRHKCWIPNFCLRASKQNDALAQSWRFILCQTFVKMALNPSRINYVWLVLFTKENIRYCAHVYTLTKFYTLSLSNILTCSPLETHYRTCILSFTCIFFPRILSCKLHQSFNWCIF